MDVEVDPQDYGATKATLGLVKETLDQHLIECAGSSREMSRQLRNLFILTAVFGTVALGERAYQLGQFVLAQLP